MAIKRPITKILRNVLAPTADGNDQVKIASYDHLTVSATVATGSGTWELLVTNDEDGDGNPQNWISLGAAAATVAQAVANYTWLQLKFVKGSSASGRSILQGFQIR